jgi:hypothetical protein
MISSNIFVYSAYCKGNIFDTPARGDNVVSCPEVNVIAVFRISSNEVASQPKIICKLWYDDVRESKDGISSASQFGDIKQSQEHENVFRPYIVNCENQFPSLIPYGVSVQEDLTAASDNVVIRENKLESSITNSAKADYTGFIHIQPFSHPSQRIHLKDEAINVSSNVNHVKRHPGVVACLGPSSKARSSAASPQGLTEQVLLQNYFGINNFVIYDSGAVSPNFLGTIAERQSEVMRHISKSYKAIPNDAKLSVKIAPWNIPISHGKAILSTADEFEVAQMDCYFRTVSKYSTDAFESSVFLEPAQVIVPKKTKENVRIKSVPKLLHHVAATTLSQGKKVSRKYLLSVKKFCSEYPSDEDNPIVKHAISALTKSTYNSEISKVLKKTSLSYYAHNLEQSDQAVDVETSIAVIHDYGPCGDIMDDTDDAFEKTDKTLVELGEDIDDNIGKYFQSTVLSKLDQEKLFRQKPIRRL